MTFYFFKYENSNFFQFYFTFKQTLDTIPAYTLAFFLEKKKRRSFFWVGRSPCMNKKTKYGGKRGRESEMSTCHGIFLPLISFFLGVGGTCSKAHRSGNTKSSSCPSFCCCWDKFCDLSSAILHCCTLITVFLLPIVSPQVFAQVLFLFSLFQTVSPFLGCRTHTFHHRRTQKEERNRTPEVWVLVTILMSWEC